METLTAKEIAQHIGVDHTRARGCQDWTPDTHRHLTISELVLDPPAGEENHEIHPFRVIDKKAGTTHTRLQHETQHIFDHGHVKTAYDDTLAMNRHKNQKIVPAIYEVIPELDPDQADKFVEFKGRVYDLTADGRILNPRPIPSLPEFSVEDDQVVVHAHTMHEKHQAALVKHLSGKAKVIAPLAKV